MLKIHSFFQRFYKLVKSSVSKKTYRTCAIISTSMIILAVVALTSKDFGGSGKNRMVAADSINTTMESDYEDEEVKALASNEEAIQESAEELVIENNIESVAVEAVIEENIIPQSTSTGDVYTTVGVEVSQRDYDALLRIVQAEAGGEDDTGKILVANVIINRVKSNLYPDTIIDVIYDNKHGVQFEPTMYKWFEGTVPSEETKACVERALAGEDHSKGALYFAVKTSSNSWHNTKLTFLFKHMGHYFYM